MRRNNRIFIVALSAVVLIGLAMFAIRINAHEKSETQATTYSTTGAPQPIAPLTGTAFVESDLTLAWDWPIPLPDRQAFAVRLWFGTDAPREVWTAETSLPVQELIDSYSQDVGDYHWQVAVIRIAEGGGFESMVSEWSPVQTLSRVRHLSPEPFPQAQQLPLTRYILSQDLPSTSAIIDYTRRLIYDHALLPDGGSNENNDIAIQMMYDNIQGKGEKPPLWCDGRSTAMLVLLREMGIDSHLIFLYGDNTSKIQEHTFLEVFNPDTQRWEVQDPTYNIYYVDTETQARASIERLVFGSLDTIAACDETAGTCSPDHVKPYQRYLEAFRYGYSDTFWVNPDRFDVGKRFPENNNANLAEYLTGKPREFKFYFDSWTKDIDDADP